MPLVLQLRVVFKAATQGSVAFTATILAAVDTAADLHQESVGQCLDGSYDASCEQPESPPSEPSTGVPLLWIVLGVLAVLVLACGVTAITCCLCRGRTAMSRDASMVQSNSSSSKGTMHVQPSAIKDPRIASASTQEELSSDGVGDVQQRHEERMRHLEAYKY